MRLEEESREVRAKLYQNLGVEIKKEDIVTILVIAKNEFAGHDAILTLLEQSERLYKKKIAQNKIRFITLPTLEAASKSPHLERASFIFIPDENLLTVEAYPELEKILPFER